jgi:hypothetical protein
MFRLAHRQYPLFFDQRSAMAMVGCRGGLATLSSGSTGALAGLNWLGYLFIIVNKYN